MSDGHLETAFTSQKSVDSSEMRLDIVKNQNLRVLNLLNQDFVFGIFGFFLIISELCSINFNF